MNLQAFLQTVPLLLAVNSLVDAAKQQVQLSDSYLPVAMQVIAHLTDQMAFEVRDESTPKPTAKPPVRPTTRPTTTTTKKYEKPTTTSWWKPPSSSSWWKPTSPTTTSSWWKPTTNRLDLTTPYHKPGYYAPAAPPKPSERYNRFQQRYVLLPLQQNSRYTILEPQETRTEEPLLSIQHEEVKPLMEPGPGSAPLLPPHYDVKVSSRSDGYVIDDISEENLQYLSEDVREMIKMANSPHDDKVVDVWEGTRQGPQPSTKAKLSQSNLRLLLLYDLLTRDAKRQRLSDYSGFSPDVMKALVESSNGGAREQLRMALSKMVDRHDCGHEYANNRAKEMVAELAKDESLLSAELRYLQPLVYKF